MSEILKYPYKSKAWTTIAGVVFFGAITAWSSYQALTNDRGLIVNGIFRFSAEGATTFYWGMAGLSALLAVLGIFVGSAGLSNPLTVMLTDTELSAPKHGFSSKATVIPLLIIKNVEIQVVMDQRFINVHYQNGEISIAESMLPSSEAFEKLHTTLVARIKNQPNG